MSHDLLLYHRVTCPFCRKVRDYLDSREIVIPMKDVGEDSDIREELRAIAGKTQVPCLIIDGKPLHESDLIVDWFAENWS